MNGWGEGGQGLWDDRYTCNDCGEEFVDDGSMICPNCEGGDLIETAEVYDTKESTP